MKNSIKLSLSVAVFAVTFAMLSQASAGARSNTSCLDPAKASSYVTSLTRGTGTLSLRDNKPLCEEANLVLQSFNVPDTWDGKGWNPTAIPQTRYASTSFTVPANDGSFKQTIEVDVPDECKHTQLDFYFAPGYESITTMTGDDELFIYGKLFAGKDKCEEPKTIEVCKLSVKEIFTINEEDFDPTKHSKNLDDCKDEPVVPEEITVCELSSKNTITIKEDEFNADIHSKDLTDCDEEEVVPPTEQPEVLPITGAGSIAAVFGASTALGAAAHYLRHRFGNRF